MGAEGRRPPVCRYEGLSAFRYSSYDTPFWARANSTSGRWHEAGEIATQHLALHPDGAWAELARAEDLRTDADLALVRMPIWVARISEQLVADYHDFAAAERAGVPPDALVDDDHARCQAEGRRLRGLGLRGVIAPSAALPGHLNLTLFGPRVMSAWTPAPELASSIPAAKVAVGEPPVGLAARVRFVGQPHAGLRAHRRDERRARRDAHP